jgi:hypothetical protein
MKGEEFVSHPVRRRSRPEKPRLCWDGFGGRLSADAAKLCYLAGFLRPGARLLTSERQAKVKNLGSLEQGFQLSL